MFTGKNIPVFFRVAEPFLSSHMPARSKIVLFRAVDAAADQKICRFSFTINCVALRTKKYVLR